MDPKIAFGQVVKTLRKKRGWSQRELASCVPAISLRTIGKIERGEKPYIDHETVALLANAFGLEALTREEFFSQAGLSASTSRRSTGTHELDETEVHDFYARVEFPAYIHDPLFNLHSINSAMLALFGTTIEDYHPEISTASGPNLLRILFEMLFEAKNDWAKDKAWRTHVEMLIYRLRVLSQKYSASQMYFDLIADLNRNPEFKVMWQRVEKPDFVPKVRVPSVFHLRTGEELQFIIVTTIDTSLLVSEVHRIIFLPSNEAAKSYLVQKANAVPPHYIIFDRSQPAGYTKISLAASSGI